MSKKINILILIIFSIITLIFIYNDDFLYSKQIMKITNIETIDTYELQNPLGLKEKYYNKKITGIVTNGKNKNKEKIVYYNESYSSVITDKYKLNDKVFVKNNEIDGLKRDYYVVSLITVFIVLIYLVGSYKGLLSVFSVILNCIVFYLGLNLYFRGINILFICIIESIIFSILSLFIAGGINKKTLSAIISVVTSTIIMLLALLVIVGITKYSGVNFNELNFLTIPPEDILLPELLIGSVGAIMDVSITMSSSISELIDKDKNISVKSLNKSSKQIGKDIMGTMSNVLFFTYLAASLPLFVLAIRNGYSIHNYITTNYSLEITRFLVGSIGIIMTIPISTFITIKIFKRGVK